MSKHFFVAIIMGSKSDLETIQPAFALCRELGLPFEAHIYSAHRTPAELQEYMHQAEERGCAVYIAAAGMAAHLAGVIASKTQKPVIGIPLNASMNGLDSLLSTVQMPSEVPVACMSIGSAGAKNAVFFAAKILALHDPNMAAALLKRQQVRKQQLRAYDEELQESLRGEALNDRNC